MDSQTQSGIAIAMTIVFVAFLYFFIEVWGPKILISLAKKDVWWSPVRMRPPSGQYAIISYGHNKGPMSRIIYDIPGYYLDRSSQDPQLWRFTQGMNPHPDRTNMVLRGVGIVWVGFNKAYFLQPTEYAVWEKLPGQSDFGVVGKKRNETREDPYYFFQYVVAVKATGVETMDNFPVDATEVLTVRHRYPVKVQFFAGKWSVRTTAAVEASIRNYGSKNKFNDFVADSAHAKQTTSGMAAQIKGLSEPNPDDPNENVTVKFGLEFDDPNFVELEITPGTEAAAIAKATAALGVAEAEGDAEIMREKKRALAAVEKAKSITAEYDARIQSGREHAGSFRMAEAIETATENFQGDTLVLGGVPGTSIPLGK